MSRTAQELVADALLASVRQSPIATVLTDARQHDNPILAVNAAFTKLTGYAEADCVGRNCRFLAGRSTEAPSRAILREAVAAGRPCLVELINYRKDGTQFRNAVMIAPILDDDGQAIYFIGSQMEVAAEAGLPQALRQQRAAEQIARLSPRQRQVLEQMLRGQLNKQIAAALGINEKTVKMHRACVLTKLGVATSADAIRIGVEAGL